MPWKASSVMEEERLRFVARLLDGEAMTDVEFGVSRKIRELLVRRRDATKLPV